MDERRDSFELRRDEVHVWQIRLDVDDGALPAMRALLDRDEAARADRFRFERHRRRFTAAHAATREILARYVGERPEALRFLLGPAGKPELTPAVPRDPVLRFNLTHSHELALVAVTGGRMLGVDVEHLRPLENAEGLVERFFTGGERNDFLALPPAERNEAFFHGWTRKEAYMKATGRGLGLPPDRFRVTLLPGDPVRLLETYEDPDEADRWRLESLAFEAPYVGAVVVEGRDWTLVRRRWS